MRVTINLHPAQTKVIRERKRFNVLSCGRRWGKSRLAFALAFETITQNGIVAYACPTATDYEKRWQEAVEFFHPVTKEIHVSDGVIEFINGNRMEWFGLHRDVNIRGNRYHRFMVDEAAHAPNLESAWQQAIRATLSDFRGDAYFMSTPNGMNFFKTLYDRHTQMGQWQAWQMPTSTNPFISPDEIEDARRELPSIVFRQEYLAEFVSSEGARVKREWLRYSDRPQCVRYAMGVDLAASLKTEADYTAIVVVGEDADGVIHVVDVMREQIMFNDILNAVKMMAAKWNPDVIAIEQVQAQAYVVQELIRTTILPVQPMRANGDKVARFMPVEGKIEHGFVKFERSLPLWYFDELLAFPDPKSKDDMVDATTYAVLGLSQTLQIVAL